MTTDIQTSDALTIDTELRQIAGEVQAYRWRAADLVIRMESIRGWGSLGYETKTAWLASFKESRSTLYEAVKHRKALPGVEPAVLDGLTGKNLKYFRLLPESRREDPVVLEKARGSEAEFVAYLNSEHGLNVTTTRKLVFDFEDMEQAAEISEAVKVYAQAEGCTREQALWEIVMSYGN